MKATIVMVFLLLILSATLVAASEEQVSKGRDLFIRNCIACHAFACNRDGQEANSPKLAGLFGRKAGGVEDFDGYSVALRNSEIVWNDETLDAYLKDPSRISPDNAMANEKIDDAVQRKQMIAYLKTEDPSVDIFCSE
jgi:cytochrome c